MKSRWGAATWALMLGALVYAMNCGGTVSDAPILEMGGASGTGGASTDGAVIKTGCGNGRVEGNEECDGPDLASETCLTATLGAQPLGTLSCTKSCTFDTTRCIAPPPGQGGTGGYPATGGRGGYGSGGYSGYGGYGYGGYSGYAGRGGYGGYAGYGGYGYGGYGGYGYGGVGPTP